MFIPIIPAALDDFTSVALVLLLRRVGEHAHIVVHVKVEQWARLSSCFVDDKVVKGVMLLLDPISVSRTCGMMRSS